MESRFKPVTIWATSATFGFCSMFATALWHSVKVEDLRAQLVTERAIKQEQDRYFWTLQNQLANAHKLNGALELENITCE